MDGEGHEHFTFSAVRVMNFLSHVEVQELFFPRGEDDHSNCNRSDSENESDKSGNESEQDSSEDQSDPSDESEDEQPVKKTKTRILKCPSRYSNR